MSGHTPPHGAARHSSADAAALAALVVVALLGFATSPPDGGFWWTDAPRHAHEVRPGLVEVPITTLRMFNRNFPSSGGGYFRLLPYALSRWMLNRVNRVDGQSGIFYFHPWEIDAGQPRIDGIGSKTRFRHYVNIDRMESRLRQLLRDFQWGRMDQIFLGAPQGRRVFEPAPA